MEDFRRTDEVDITRELSREATQVYQAEVRRIQTLLPSVTILLDTAFRGQLHVNSVHQLAHDTARNATRELADRIEAVVYALERCAHLLTMLMGPSQRC